MRYFWIAAGLLLLVYLLSGIRQVSPGERLVVRRFGRVLEYKPGPGLWLGLPWGMDRADRVSVDRVRRVSVGYQPDLGDRGPTTPDGQLLSGDHNLVNVQVMVDYTVRDDQVADYVLVADQVDGLLERAAESELAAWVAGRTVDDVLRRGKGQLPAWLVARTQDRVQPYRLGIEIQKASVAYLLPPDGVREAFDDVTRADAERETRKNEARQEARRIEDQALAEKRALELAVAPYVTNQLKLAEEEVAYLEGLRKAQNSPAHLTAQLMDNLRDLMEKKRQRGQLKQLPEGIEVNVPGRGER